MSKFHAKNLHYDTTLPPFLARLQANRSDRSTFQAVRPTKLRNADEDAEDEPVYFDEENGETLTKGEWERREGEREKFADGGATKGKYREEGGKEGGWDGKEEVGGEVNKKVASIGMSRKRKAGKVVGGEEEEGAEKPEIETGGSAGKKTAKAKAPKKGKKVKLSFGDDE